MTELEQLKVDIFILESKLKMEKSFSLAILSLLGPEDARQVRRLELMERVIENVGTITHKSKKLFEAFKALMEHENEALR